MQRAENTTLSINENDVFKLVTYFDPNEVRNLI